MRGSLRGATLLLVAVVGLLGSGCGGGGNRGGGGGSQGPVTPTVTVSPASTAITTVQPLKVTVSVVSNTLVFLIVLLASGRSLSFHRVAVFLVILP